ncbi:MAG: hypothetical protein Q8P87_00865 [bacterium]|nr:hypothetical protein [bacterium]
MTVEAKPNIFVAGWRRAIEKHGAGPETERPSHSLFPLMTYTYRFWNWTGLNPFRPISSSTSNRELALAAGKFIIPFYTLIAAEVLDAPIALSRYLRCTAEVIGERIQQKRAA